MLNDLFIIEPTRDESAIWERNARNAEREADKHRPITLDVDALNALDRRAQLKTRLRIRAAAERRTYSRTWVTWYEDAVDFLEGLK